MNTHKFTLPSGVSCEVKELTGKHQRILTEQKSKKIGENLNEVLVDVIVSVGTKLDIDLEFVQKMLSADKKKILVEVRQFSNDNDPLFKFNYEYLGTNAKGEEEKMSEPMEVNLEGGFPAKQYHKQWTEYADIERDVTITLPKSGQVVKFRMLDGEGESVGAATKKAERSTHTALEMRFPRFMQKTSADTIPVKLNLDTLAIKDIEYLRAQIKEKEGQVDTEIMIKHPEADNKPMNEKEIIIDVVGVLAFFFPSEAI